LINIILKIKKNKKREEDNFGEKMKNKIKTCGES